MSVATIVVGVVVVAIIAAAAFVVIRDHRSGNHCASCRGCSMGSCGGKRSCCQDFDDEEKKD